MIRTLFLVLMYMFLMPVLGVSGMVFLWSAINGTEHISANALSDFMFGIASMYGFWQSFRLCRVYANAFQEL